MSEKIKLIRSLEAVPKEWKKFQTINVEITLDDGDRLLTEWDELEYKTQDLKEILREIPQPTEIIKGSKYYLSIMDDIIYLERNKSLGRLHEAQSRIAKIEGKLENHRRAFKRIQFISKNWNDTNAIVDECYLIANKSLGGIDTKGLDE